MKLVDKLRNKVTINKRLMTFLFIISIIGIIFGSIYTIILSKSDKELVSEYLLNFVNSIKDNKIDYLSVFFNTLIANLSFIIIIWLLGMSVIGIPISLIMFFSKSYILGFSIGSIISNYGITGIIFGLFYIFPHQIINIFIYILLLIYSISLSLKMINSIFKKKTIDFKIIMNKYLFILLISIISIIITSLIEAYLMPNILKIVTPLLK